ncbi:MAG: energy transducer TonB [Akkermansiaceae bacterium]
MFLKSIFTGTLITAILVSVLAATRLMNTDAVAADLVLYEIEEIMMTPEPEPPLEEEKMEEEEMAESLPQAPIPAMDLLTDNSIDSTPLPLTTASFDPKLAVSPFEIDREPADLPVVKSPPKPKPVTTKRTYTPKSKPKPRSKPSPPPREVIKSSYSPSELDRMPRELRQGSFTWPSSAKGTNGTVKILLEISTSGRVKVLSVLSSSDSRLVSAAKRVASGSRYTAPTYRGKPVKTKFYKTYHLKKPRR